MTDAPTMSPFSDRILANLRSPNASDNSQLVVEGESIRCDETGEVFPIINGIPSLFAPSPGEGIEVTERVRSFYEENPFPSYEGLEEFGELVS
ncbi:Trm112 family protein, partial [Rhodospirillales bacterium]|nr:Trm112 family protein [Rhodospirillales bacterium]